MEAVWIFDVDLQKANAIENAYLDALKQARDMFSNDYPPDEEISVSFSRMFFYNRGKDSTHIVTMCFDVK